MNGENSIPKRGFSRQRSGCEGNNACGHGPAPGWREINERAAGENQEIRSTYYKGRIDR